MFPRRTIFICLCLAIVTLGVCASWRFIFPESRDRDLESNNRPALKRPIQAALPTVSGSSFQTSSAGLAASDNDWPAEAFVDRASGLFKLIKKSVAHQQQPKKIKTWLADDFRVSVPKHDALPIYQDGTISAWRQGSFEYDQVAGNAAIEEFLRRLTPTSNNASIMLMKIVEIDLKQAPIDSMVRVESSGNNSEGTVQQIQTWRCRWKKNGERPVMATATLVQHQRSANSGKKLFVDRTEAMLGANTAFQTQLRFGLHHWLGRIESAHGMKYFVKLGLAVADVNGDGLDDIYVCQPAALPNRLYIRNIDGSVTEQAAQFGIDVLDRTASALFVDLDNDGDQDLAVASLVGLLVYENKENRHFAPRAVLELPDSDLQGVSAVDYDQDGDLDLYQIVDYASDVSRAKQGLPSFVYHNANDGGANRLFRNEIDGNAWNFRDVTDAVGLSVNNQRHSLAAAWQDYDEDGDADLYVANDYGQNCLYKNDGGRFTESSTEAGVTDFGSGMSVCWGDYDRDGRSDLYVSNMFSAAGNRIAPQNQFLPKMTSTGRALYKRFAKGNSLFRNLGNGRFEETGRPLGVEVARWAWGSVFADVNNDGWEDLLVANGYITTPDTGDL